MVPSHVRGEEGEKTRIKKEKEKMEKRKKEKIKKEKNSFGEKKQHQ